MIIKHQLSPQIGAETRDRRFPWIIRRLIYKILEVMMSTEPDDVKAAIMRQEIQASEFRNAKMPAFWREEPKLWFAMLEREFSAYNVKSDAVKCAAVIRHLDTVSMKVVADVISAPPSADSYGDIKNALITRLATSEETQLRQLLTGIELNDRKPSELLREMTRLAGSNVTPYALQTLWLQRLPKRIQELLAVIEDVELNKLAELADKAMERSNMQELAVVAYPGSSTEQAQSNTEITELTKRLARLETLIKKTSQGRSRSRGRFQKGFVRGRNASRSKSRDKSTGVCYFHSKFGKEAWKCRKPCTWTDKKSDDSEN